LEFSFIVNEYIIYICTLSHADLAEHLNIDRFSLLGHSMGGRTVMTFALHHPHIVQKLIVVDVSPVSLGADFREMEGKFTYRVSIV
jgi:pimeloyl-ACP methyl ester carboxylesterase